MSPTTATAQACANIAFIKYWGNRDDALRLPANSSISMNLDGLYAETTVQWLSGPGEDQLVLNETPQSGDPLRRVSAHLERVRAQLGTSSAANVRSVNNFPTGAGIASSAAAFAALTAAAVSAAGARLSERELSILARTGSGSASRSVPDGFVEWFAGDSHETSYAESFAPADYWALTDLVAIVSQAHKAVGSTAGHPTATTSDLQSCRVAGAQERFDRCRQAVLERDFATFAEVVELDSNQMHAVMMTSRPSLFYWLPESVLVMCLVRQWRAEGLRVCYTLDAGPNVHCLCEAADATEIERRLRTLAGVQDVRSASPGPGARVVSVE
ncbi:MAG: diphosphomevalonate decarboxylase [Anaerolineae bacterium]|nr:diphosphomevalonate decarboxylase [Anaerolineae bacterium]